jgi:DNA-binding Lrp family transcriptional regulator
VIWKHKVTLLKGLPEVIYKRYREEKKKWVLLLRAAKEMNVAISAGEVVNRILRETGVINREGFVVNVRKLHRAVPLLSMDEKTTNVQEIMFRIYVNFMAKNDPDNAELSFDNTENWYKKNGWRVPFVSNAENKTLNEMIFGHLCPGTKTLQQLMDEMDAKFVQDKKDLCDKLSSGSQDVTVINQKITPVKHMRDGNIHMVRSDKEQEIWNNYHNAIGLLNDEASLKIEKVGNQFLRLDPNFVVGNDSEYAKEMEKIKEEHRAKLHQLSQETEKEFRTHIDIHREERANVGRVKHMDDGGETKEDF